MRTWKEIKDRHMTKAEQAEAHRLAAADMAEMELGELRETLAIRQAELAGKLKTTQAAISRLERQKNIEIGTLAKYIRGLGGELEVSAKIGDRFVRLTQFGRHPMTAKTRTAVKSRGHRAAARAANA